MASLTQTSLLTKQAALRTPNAPRAPLALKPQLRSFPVAKAQAGGSPPPSPPPPTNQKTETKDKKEKVIEELKQSGITPSTAQAILTSWEKMGVTEPDQLRKLLVSRSLTPLVGLSFQTLIDGVAAWGALYFGDFARTTPGLPGGFILQGLGYFFFFYYSIQVLAEFSVAGALLYSAYRFGTSSPELLAAVQQLAKPQGLNAVDKVQVAVNTMKVMQELDTLSKLLKDQFGNPSNARPQDALRNLSVYLIMSNARDKLGFKHEDYGLTEKEAGDIAYAFSTYDKNDNYKLELSELKDLCQNLDEGCPLDDKELKEAYNKLDANKSGYVEFTDFVQWWVKKKQTASVDA